MGRVASPLVACANADMLPDEFIHVTDSVHAVRCHEKGGDGSGKERERTDENQNLGPHALYGRKSRATAF